MNTLTEDQTRRVRESLSEALTLLGKWTNRYAPDSRFEAEKQEKIKFYTQHAAKLQGMLDGSN